MLKEILIEEYNKYSDQIKAIANILAIQGKVTMAQRLSGNTISLDLMIMSENYYITNFDIELLAKRFNIPLILILSTRLVDNDKPILIVNGKGQNAFYFIKVPGIKADIVLKYRLFIQEKNMLLKLHDFAISLQTDIRKADELNIDKYLKENIKRTKSLPKKPQKLTIID